MCGISNMAQMNLSMKHRLMDTREQTCGCPGGAGWGRNGTEGWSQLMEASIRGGDKQQNPTVQHKELYSMSYDKL